MPTFKEILDYLFNVDLQDLVFNTDWYGVGVWGFNSTLAADYELALDDANQSLTKEQAVIAFENKCYEPLLEYYFSLLEARQYA